MASIRARYPELIKLADPPLIIGHQCAQCERRAFPPDRFGCEQCGADPDQLQRIDLPATGSVLALATVHRHHNPRPETPFTVATIVLDGGISLKGVLAGGGPAVEVGSRVRAVTIPWETDDDGNEIVDLRFELDGSGN